MEEKKDSGPKVGYCHNEIILLDRKWGSLMTFSSLDWAREAPTS